MLMGGKRLSKNSASAAADAHHDAGNACSNNKLLMHISAIPTALSPLATSSFLSGHPYFIENFLSMTNCCHFLFLYPHSPALSVSMHETIG